MNTVQWVVVCVTVAVEFFILGWYCKVEHLEHLEYKRAKKLIAGNYYAA